jgi:hypothetical protein
MRDGSSDQADQRLPTLAVVFSESVVISVPFQNRPNRTRRVVAGLTVVRQLLIRWRTTPLMQLAIKQACQTRNREEYWAADKILVRESSLEPYRNIEGSTGLYSQIGVARVDSPGPAGQRVNAHGW